MCSFARTLSARDDLHNHAPGSGIDTGGDVNQTQGTRDDNDNLVLLGQFVVQLLW